jgi:Pyruvate/2-oxoacid:ferredoxin oxidoreductase gamma subunit
MIRSIFLTGLGGQGVLTAAGILADQASEAGLKVSLFNAKGMAQRGGRVTSEVRLTREQGAEFGARISAGGADVLIGMEIGEAINSLPFLREGGIALLLNHAYVPAEAVLKKQPYPAFRDALELFGGKTEALYGLEHPESPHNVFVLGAFAAIAPEVNPELDFYSAGNLEQALSRKLKRGLEENLRAFRRGVECGTTLRRRA